jgi:hypothetical protein
VSTWSERARTAGRHTGAVAWRLLAVVGGLELFYLLCANLILSTPLLRNFAASSDDLSVDYGSAYSLIPGRIEVKGLRVRMHDHNVEFEVAVERGTLDVSLHELARKRFHALRVDADAVGYRMRHRLSRVGLQGPRVAAYPPIAGFADPPLFRGPPSPPIPDAEYDLWEVNVENITARVREIWILEYRYRGPGVARGRFLLRPARYYEVGPATLDLDGGSLRLGRETVSERTELHLGMVVSGSDPRRLQGLEPLEKVVADARGRFTGTDLRFLDAYLGPHAGAIARGAGDVDFDVHFHQGALVPPTTLKARFSDVVLRGSDFEVRTQKLAASTHTEAEHNGVRGHSELAFGGMTANFGERHSGRFDATLVGDDLAVPLRETTPASGTIRLHVDRAAALLPLATPPKIVRDLEESLLNLQSLDATARLRGGKTPLLDLRDAHSGRLKVTGYYLGRAEQPEGAFLLRTPAANVGVRVTSKGTEWSPLVSDEWLKDEAARTRGRQADAQNPFAND